MYSVAVKFYHVGRFASASLLDIMSKSGKQAWNKTVWSIPWRKWIVKQKPENVVVCLFVVLRPTRYFFHSYWDVTGEGLQMFTHSRQSYPFSSKLALGSLACQTYCDATHPLIDNGHQWRHVPLAHVVERLALELSLPALTT